MERVFYVGGIIVLLFSEDYYRCFIDCKESSIFLNFKDSYIDEFGIKKCLNFEEKIGVFKIVLILFEVRNYEFLDRMLLFGFLVLVECYKVSFGKIDVFICKYKKLYFFGL